MRDKEEHLIKGRREGEEKGGEESRMRNVCEIVLKDEAMEALEREAGNRGKTPGELAEEIVRDWLVSRGNLRIF